MTVPTTTQNARVKTMKISDETNARLSKLGSVSKTVDVIIDLLDFWDKEQKK